MSCNVTKLEYLEETKRLFREKIDPSGTKITDETPFRDYVGFFESGLVERTAASLTSNANAVAEYAFYYNDVLETVDLPMATSIGKNAFYQCVNLKSVNLPLAVDIGYNAFYRATKLTSVDLPMATSIGEGAFQDTPLTVVEIPKVISIGKSAFRFCDFTIINLPMTTFIGSKAFWGCLELTTVILKQQCTLENTDAFYDTPLNDDMVKTGYIYVPAALVEWYKADTVWVTFADQIRALEDYTVDGTIDGELDETKI